MKLTELRTTNKKGVTVSTEFYSKKDAIQMRIKKGGKITNDIYYSEKQFQELVGRAVGAGQEIQKGGREIFSPVSNSMTVEQKLDMIQGIADSISYKQMQEVEGSKKLQQIRNNEVVQEITGRPYSYRPIEKTKEHVLQKVYEQIGTRWFSSKEFKQIYNKSFEKGSAESHLQKMQHKELERRDAPDEKYEDWRVNYEYRLNQETLDRIEEHGSLTSETDPRWRKKKWMMKKPKGQR